VNVKATRRQLLLITLTLACAACSSSWSRRSLDSLTPLPARQQLQVWQGTRAIVVHGVQVDSTRLTAIPYYQRLDCDSCLIALPRLSIDSVRVGNVTDGVWRTTAVLATLFIAGVAYCVRGGCGGN
jgi:hypothetical protein